MDALVANRGTLGRFYNIASGGKSIGTGITTKRIPIPKISANQILVKVNAVALNPVDFKCADLLGSRDSVLGCDYAGTVSKVGASAPGNWKKGDRVAGFVHGGHYYDNGSFATYVKVDGDLAWRVPESVTDEESSTYGVPAVTAFVALSTHLGLPVPPDAQAQRVSGGGTVLIYSGSTAVGLFAIQLAKKAGYTVVTTASPRSFDLVKEYGADHVYDYRSKTAADEIAKAHPNITQALDCISAGTSTEFCTKVIKAKGGKVVTLYDVGKSKTKGVEYVSVMVFTVFGQAYAILPPIGPKFPASAYDRDSLAKFYAELPRMVRDVRPPPIKVLGMGYEKIILGLDDLRQGKVSGQKLVANL